LQASLRAGPRAWPALADWGRHCRWLGDGGDALQREADACGPAALAALLATCGRGAPGQSLLWSICRRPCGGTTLGGLAAAARALGYSCDVQWCGALAMLEPPAIVHLRRGHFVVLEARAAHAARILDPAWGRLTVPWPVLDARSSGAVLVLVGAKRRSPPEGT
jgi:ABC-type bacteriocin/lantibiotic exporter with double-glycine peptidase domain